ncbi:MAG TPA: 50S ribosomal protein L24 [Chthonomonadaceae bacterium]|nr:50S ribosomal protein L24 [Chthonomonadaceae bacterium]
MPIPKRSTPKEPVKLKVKKGDTVEVISGKDKGKRGQVLTAYPKENKVTVQGANMIVRHTKDRPSNRPGAEGINRIIKGGRVEKEAPLFASKVMVVCPSCHRPTRVGYAYREGTDKPSRRKYRVCKHPDCGKAIDVT